MQSQPIINKCELIDNDIELPRSIIVDHHIVEKLPMVRWLGGLFEKANVGEEPPMNNPFLGFISGSS